MRAALAVGALGWAGATLLLGQLRWFSRPSLTERLRPYVAATPRVGTVPLAQAASTGALARALAGQIGEAVSRLAGPPDPLEDRLRRLHLTTAAGDFRLRQLGGGLLGLLTGALVAAAIRPPVPLLALALLGAPVMGLLWPEHRLAVATAAWRRRVELELPVVAEQVAMLLGAGYSLGGALARVAERGQGAVAADLQRVGGRVRQGLSERAALREWAELAGVGAVTRLVGVLALERETTDLGRLVSDEARSMRADDHRRLLEHLERRAQQVWVPVTVSALVPGVLFLSVPFLEAVRLFGA